MKTNGAYSEMFGVATHDGGLFMYPLHLPTEIAQMLTNTACGCDAGDAV